MGCNIKLLKDSGAGLMIRSGSWMDAVETVNWRKTKASMALHQLKVKCQSHWAFQAAFKETLFPAVGELEMLRMWPRA